jgi:hypothetical protein
MSVPESSGTYSVILIGRGWPDKLSSVATRFISVTYAVDPQFEKMWPHTDDDDGFDKLRSREEKSRRVVKLQRSAQRAERRARNKR